MNLLKVKIGHQARRVGHVLAMTYPELIFKDQSQDRRIGSCLRIFLIRSTVPFSVIQPTAAHLYVWSPRWYSSGV